MGVRAPYFSSGSGSQGTLFDRSKTYVQGNQVLHRRENIDLDHGIGHPSSLFWKLMSKPLRHEVLEDYDHYPKGPKMSDALVKAPFSKTFTAIFHDI